MRVVLYNAISVNGILPTASKKADSWLSDESLEGMRRICRKSGVMVIGRKMYDALQSIKALQGEFLVVVMTRNEHLIDTSNDDVVFTDEEPEEILDMLEEEGFSTVCICGGGQINALFLESNLVDEIYVDIEPVIVGNGMKMVEHAEMNGDLELIEINNLNENTVQLHYKFLE